MTWSKSASAAVQLALLGADPAAVEVGVGKLRVAPQGVVEIGQGLVELAPGLVDAAALVVRFAHVRGDLEGLVELGHGRVVLAQGQQLPPLLEMVGHRRPEPAPGHGEDRGHHHRRRRRQPQQGQPDLEPRGLGIAGAGDGDVLADLLLLASARGSTNIASMMAAMPRMPRPRAKTRILPRDSKSAATGDQRPAGERTSAVNMDWPGQLMTRS